MWRRTSSAVAYEEGGWRAMVKRVVAALQGASGQSCILMEEWRHDKLWLGRSLVAGDGEMHVGFGWNEERRG